MMAFARAPQTLRSIALTVALSLATTGSGLPMCLSVLALATAPCAMHAHPTGHQMLHHQSAGGSRTAHPLAQSCHPGDAGPACTGSACPSAGPPAPAGLREPLPLAVALRPNGARPAPALRSYLSPPLAPPPQT